MRIGASLSTLVTLVALAVAGCTRGPESDPLVGRWRAVAQLPGGELPFFIDIEAGEPGRYTAEIENGEERVRVERVQWDGKTLLLDFPAFDNHIECKPVKDGLEGTLTLVKRGGKEQVMPLHARLGEGYRFFQE